MSLDRESQRSPPVTVTGDLLRFFQEAEKPQAKHLLGLEHEKLVYPAESGVPPTYDGPRGIGALLEAVQKEGSYQPFREAEGLPVIALQRGMLTVSLEPGGQLELSGSPFPTALQAHQENVEHIAELKRALAPLNLRLVALGHRAFEKIPEIPWMPKSRYRVMRQTLGERGRLALNMMLMTCTGQASFDWADEADCARKMTVSAKVGPLLVALYANSPLIEGKPCGYQSFRSRVWSEVDEARCGYFPAMIDGTFSYQRYVDWALDAPLLFLRREGQYLSPKATFRTLLESGFGGEPVTQQDWTDHLSTLFPEVRIKKVLEIRGADCVNAAMTGALGALFRGLLYDRTALEDATRLLPALSFPAHLEFHDTARRDGLEGKLGQASLGELSAELLQIARRGLIRLGGGDEVLLEPLEAQAASGRSPSRTVLDAFSRGGQAEVLRSAEL